MNRVIRGTTHAYFETGTEGIWWALVEEGVYGYEALNILEEGDRLAIYEDDYNSKVLFEGLIKKDKLTGLRSRPFNPYFKQQVALGMWIHWVQEGWEPDQWAELFMTPGKYRAVLLTAKKHPLPF